MSAHARLGPSNHRWPNCPGSVREEERYPDIPGEAAIDGTGSHLLLELCLENGVPAIQYDQQIIGVNHPDNPGGWLVTIERVRRVQMCLDYITRRVGELKEQFPGATVDVHSETKSNPGGLFGRDDWWGTTDVTILVRHPMTGDVYFIEVIDYKDGREYVNTKDNTQLLSYLGGKARPYIGSGPELVRPFRPERVEGCRVTIVQPKTNPVVRYECSTQGDGFSMSYVIDQLEKLGTAAYATDDPNAPLVPGKHCRWCKANPKRGGHCTTAAEKSLEVIETMSTDIIATDQSLFEQIGRVINDVSTLSVDDLVNLADAKDALVAAFDKVEAEIERRIETGVNVPGYAMEPGRSNRVWNEDQELVVKKLKALRLKKDVIFPPSLISVAQFMKLEGITDEQKKRIERELVTVKAGKLKLTKKAHPRVIKDVAGGTTDVLQSAEAMFNDVAEVKPLSFM